MGENERSWSFGPFFITEEVASEIKADRMNEKKDKSMRALSQAPYEEIM